MNFEDNGFNLAGINFSDFEKTEIICCIYSLLAGTILIPANNSDLKVPSRSHLSFSVPIVSLPVPVRLNSITNLGVV